MSRIRQELPGLSIDPILGKQEVDGIGAYQYDQSKIAK